MRLSVIIPCYNAATTIAGQLDALTGQRWSHQWEVIVVNNHSTDGSMEVVERYRTRLPQLRIVDAFARRSRPKGEGQDVPNESLCLDPCAPCVTQHIRFYGGPCRPLATIG